MGMSGSFDVKTCSMVPGSEVWFCVLGDEILGDESSEFWGSMEEAMEIMMFVFV